MRAGFFRSEEEYYTDEGCFISEWLNSEEDEGASIAEARVASGVTTRWHSLDGIAERYVVLDGVGVMEVGDLLPREVRRGDVVLIPPGCRQRITNVGSTDLVFLAICTPRFRPEAYEDLE